MTKLLQIKVKEVFLDKLKRISSAYNMSVSAYVKYTLSKEMLENEKLEISENGFLVEEENRIINSAKETKKEQEKGLLQSKNVNQYLEDL